MDCGVGTQSTLLAVNTGKEGLALAETRGLSLDGNVEISTVVTIQIGNVAHITEGSREQILALTLAASLRRSGGVVLTLSRVRGTAYITVLALPSLLADALGTIGVGLLIGSALQTAEFAVALRIPLVDTFASGAFTVGVSMIVASVGSNGTRFAVAFHSPQILALADVAAIFGICDVSAIGTIIRINARVANSTTRTFKGVFVTARTFIAALIVRTNGTTVFAGEFANLTTVSSPRLVTVTRSAIVVTDQSTAIAESRMRGSVALGTVGSSDQVGVPGTCAAIASVIRASWATRVDALRTIVVTPGEFTSTNVAISLPIVLGSIDVATAITVGWVVDFTLCTI